MNCHEVKSWLLKAEAPESGSWPADIQTHVGSCKTCARLAFKIRRLEDSWRDQSLPVEAEDSKRLFLRKLRKTTDKPQKEPAKSEPAAPHIPWRIVRWGAFAGSMAACVLITLGVGAFILFGGGTVPVAASPPSDIVDKLIELNLDLSNAEPKERARILADVETRYAQDLKDAKLSEEDRKFAEELLEAARTLAIEDDPLEEAEHINKLAARVKDRERTASEKGNSKELEHCNKQYHIILNRGFIPMKERIAQFKAPEGNKKPGFDSFNRLDREQQQRLHKLFEKGPGHDWEMKKVDFGKGPMGFFSSKKKGSPFGGKGGKK